MYAFWFSQIRRQDRDERHSGQWSQRGRRAPEQWYWEFGKRMLAQGVLFLVLVSLAGVV